MDAAFEAKVKRFVSACLSKYIQQGFDSGRIYAYEEGETYVTVLLTDFPDHEPDYRYAFIDKVTGDVFKVTYRGGPALGKIAGNLNNIDRLRVRMRDLYIDDSVLSERMLLRMDDVIDHCRQAYADFWNAQGFTRQAPEFVYTVGERFIIVREVYDNTKKYLFAEIERATGDVFKNRQAARPVGNIFNSHRDEENTSSDFYGVSELSKQFADFRRYE